MLSHYFQDFDGGYHHYYDGTTYAVTLVHFVKVTTPNRPYGPLIIQGRERGRPAGNCALAGREGNNMVLIDYCSGTLVIQTRFGDVAPNVPSVVLSSGNYIVYFL